MILNPSLTGTRLTPDAIEPAVGEEYRHRLSGKIGLLLSIDNELAEVRFTPGMACWYGHVNEFWRLFLHAKARQI